MALILRAPSGDAAARPRPPDVRVSSVPPRRIVSLCPSITETLVAIGGYGRLVAATRFCVRPEGMLWGLPRIGGTKNPDIPRILDLAPDLVFANAEENREADVAALQAAGIEVDVSLPRTVAEVPGLIRRWGRRLEGDSQAEELAERIEAEIDSLTSSPPGTRFLYAYWIWKDPWMTISDDTYIADLLSLAGGVNVFGREQSRYPVASPGEALARGADAHFLPSEPYPFRAEKHGEMARALFGDGQKWFFVPGDDYCWHGARTLDGLRRVRMLPHEFAASR